MHSPNKDPPAGIRNVNGQICRDTAAPGPTAFLSGHPGTIVLGNIQDYESVRKHLKNNRTEHSIIDRAKSSLDALERVCKSCLKDNVRTGR